MPDGLSPETNPSASAFWETDDPPPGETALVQVEKYVSTQVASQEVLFQALLHACGRFNRLVGKLQARADSQDFSRPTRSDT